MQCAERHPVGQMVAIVGRHDLPGCHVSLADGCGDGEKGRRGLARHGTKFGQSAVCHIASHDSAGEMLVIGKRHIGIDAVEAHRPRGIADIGFLCVARAVDVGHARHVVIAPVYHGKRPAVQSLQLGDAAHHGDGCHHGVIDPHHANLRRCSRQREGHLAHAVRGCPHRATHRARRGDKLRRHVKGHLVNGISRGHAERERASGVEPEGVIARTVPHPRGCRAVGGGKKHVARDKGRRAERRATRHLGRREAERP